MKKVTCLLACILLLVLPTGCTKAVEEQPLPTETNTKVTITDPDGFIYDKPADGYYAPGTVITLHTGVICDADLFMYVNGEFFSIQDAVDTDEGYIWEYRYTVGSEAAEITFGVIGGDPSFDEEIELLKDKYPEYFGLSVFKGLEVYVWQMGANSYSFALMEGTNRNKSMTELLGLKGVTAEQMKRILSTYDVSEEEVFIYPYQNPLSSYIGESMVRFEGETDEQFAERQQTYIDKIREMLF